MHDRHGRSRGHVQHGDVIAHGQQQVALSGVRHAIRGRHVQRGGAIHHVDDGDDAVLLVVQRLLHEQRGGVLDLFHRLLGDGREGRVLALRADKRQPVYLAGGVSTDDADIGLHFSRRRIGREVAIGRERRARRTANHHVEEHVVTTPAHIARTTGPALFELGEEGRDEVLYLLAKLRVHILQEAGQFGIADNCWCGHEKSLERIVNGGMPRLRSRRYPRHRQSCWVGRIASARQSPWQRSSQRA